jgi:thiosulfate dehydrogenase [quinone] large subunit
MFAFAGGLMLAWRVAGYYGVDRYLLPLLRVPWGSRVATASPPIGAPSG